MIVCFLVSANRLYVSSNKKVSFDQVLLTIEAAKLAMFIFS